jgi:Protein of unknown function (DUF1573)
VRTIKVLIGLGLLGVITSGTAYWFSSATLPNEPRIDAPAVVDLGAHEMSGSIEDSFRVTNRGRQPLILENFDGHCGCLALFHRTEEGNKALSRESREAIPPGGQMDIYFRLSTKGDSQGRLQHEIDFGTNDPRNPRVAVMLTAQMEVGMYTLPGQLHVGRLMPGQTVRRTLRIVDARRNRKPFQFKASSAEIRVDQCVPSDRPSDREGVTGDAPVYVLRVSITGPPTPGNFKGDVSIVDRDGAESGLFWLAGSVASTFSLHPSTVFLAGESLKTALVRGFRCLCRCEHGTLSLSVLTAPQGLKVEVSKRPHSGVQFIDVQCSSHRVPYTGTQKLVLKAVAGDGRSETIELPVTITTVGSDMNPARRPMAPWFFLGVSCAPANPPLRFHRS